MIRTVIFDIGNVLAGFSWEEHFKNLGYDGEMTQRLARATVYSDDWKEYDRGCKSDEEMERLLVEIGPEIRRVLSDLGGMVKRWDYAIPWIRELKKKGYQVLVLSNFSQKALRECWNALDFLPYVDGGILSFQDKLVKPMPEIYRLLLDRYCLKAEECVFMDDTPENVEGARRAGIHAFHFESQEQAKAELEKLGV